MFFTVTNSNLRILVEWKCPTNVLFTAAIFVWRVAKGYLVPSIFANASVNTALPNYFKIDITNAESFIAQSPGLIVINLLTTVIYECS